MKVVFLMFSLTRLLGLTAIFSIKLWPPSHQVDV